MALRGETSSPTRPADKSTYRQCHASGAGEYIKKYRVPPPSSPKPKVGGRRLVPTLTDPARGKIKAKAPRHRKAHLAALVHALEASGST
jgi:hypothetical protein